MRMNPVSKFFASVCFISTTAFALIAHAQPLIPPTGDVAQNKQLRIQIDRAKIRAFEPLYLCLVAEQFAPGVEAEVQISHQADVWQPIVLPAKDWVKTQLTGPVVILRRGIVLQATEKNGIRSFLFNTAGDYKLRVKIGPDSTTLNLTVTPPEAGEEASWNTLGDRIEDVLENSFPNPPEQGTKDACARIIRKYPRTLCASYCQSYLSISQFKALFEKNSRGGGKAVYAQVTEDLQKIADSFHEGFFGEMTAFYAAYAKGLTGDFPGMLAIADGMKTHMTPWNEGVMEMRAEVMSHLAPRVIPVDPGKPLPGPDAGLPSAKEPVLQK